MKKEIILEKEKNSSFIVRIYFLTDKIYAVLYKSIVLCKAFFDGFWLGILRKENFHLIDRICYDNNKMYHDEKYNKKGLSSWEKAMINKYFKRCKLLLVGAVGGGREALALSQLGYDVDGFECNLELVEYANKLLKKEGFTPDIKLIPPDQCLDSTKKYDGLIIGWGAYSLIQGRKERITFLKKLRTLTRKNSPLLLSFLHREYDSTKIFKITVKVGNIIRGVFKSKHLELGDKLIPNYTHFFIKEEIASELQEGGFKLKFYSTEKYGHAVGIAM